MLAECHGLLAFDSYANMNNMMTVMLEDFRRRQGWAKSEGMARYRKRGRYLQALASLSLIQFA